MQLTAVVVFLAGWSAFAQQTAPPAVPPATPPVAPPSLRLQRHSPLISQALVDFYRSQVELGTATAAFEGSLTSKQKQVLEQMQDIQKRIADQADTLCAKDETAQRAARGQPVCVLNKPVLTPAQIAAAHEALRKKLCDPDEDVDDTTNPNIPACVKKAK
jgi:hypothetical protein